MESLLREGIVTNHRLRFRETVHQGELVDVNLAGWVATANGGRVYVNKWLSVTERPTRPPAVQTREYAYHGRFVLSPRVGQQLFRYDNCHGGPETLHRHRYDIHGNEADIVAIRIDQMPSLSEVIREAEFYAHHLRELRRS